MDSLRTSKRHVVCVPFRAQGHVNPFMQFAKLLHCLGFHTTFVNTEFNRFVRFHGADFVKGLPDFVFETIPDGLPPSDKDATQDVPSLVAKDFGVPDVQLWTASACGFLGYLQFDDLVKRDILPFKGTIFFLFLSLPVFVSAYV
ncbi:unnamed protein product [Sphenostylis stenocarpa]|uniref:Uncharacterized protein n=1 Tax=Sphenostylis stenocarpa TaxID=92480 RepID=A0AA86VHS9_9FABA|nr:unnamed protein product [Sphenostylis stenocarpa]